MGGMRLQPQGGARLNIAHSLAAALQFAYVPGVGDVTRKHAALTNPTLGASRFGRATRPLNAAPYPTFGTLDVKSTGSFSVVLVGDFASPSAYTAPLLSLYSGNGGWKFGIAGGGVVGYTNFGVADYTGSTLVDGLSGVLSMSCTINSSVRIFTGGNFRESITIGSMLSGSGASFTVGNRTGGTDIGSPSRVALALYFDRALTDAEHRLIATNPWALFADPTEGEVLGDSPPASNSLEVRPVALQLSGGEIAMRVSRRVLVQATQLQLAGADVAVRATRKMSMQPAVLSFASGQVDLRAARRVAVSAADLVLGTGAAQLRATRRLPVTAAEIALQPGPVQLRAVRRLAVTPAVATLVGGSIEFVYTPAEEGNSYSIPVSPAALAFTGGNVTMRVTRKIAATPAALTLATGDVRMLAARKLGVGAAALQATAGRVLLRAARCLPVAPAQLLVVGGAVTLRYSSQVEYTRAPVGAGYSPQRVEVQARPAQLGGSRPASTQRNNR